MRIRIDPMIPIPGWEKDYKVVVECLEELHPDRITLGTLRYLPGLPGYSRHNTDVFKYASIKEGTDNRHRVPRIERWMMYQVMLSKLKAMNCEIGLCKETESMWKHIQLRRGKCNCTV